MSNAHSRLPRYRRTTLKLDVQLHRGEREGLAADLRAIGPITDEDVTDALIDRCREAVSDNLAPTTLAFLVEAVRGASPVVLRGMGLLDDPLPPTPSKGGPRHRLITKALHLAATTLAGEPATYDVEQDGTLFHYLISEAGKEHTLTGRGGAPLGQHNDLAALDDNPDTLAITCLRTGDPVVPTRVASLEAALGRLSANKQAQLQQPDWDVAVTADGGGRWLITGDGGVYAYGLAVEHAVALTGRLRPSPPRRSLVAADNDLVTLRSDVRQAVPVVEHSWPRPHGRKHVRESRAGLLVAGQSRCAVKQSTSRIQRSSGQDRRGVQ